MISVGEVKVENVIIDSASWKVAWFQLLSSDSGKADKITQPYSRLKQ